MRQRILLVDDSPTNLFMLEQLLQPTGCELLRATNGEEALEWLQRTPVALVVTDVMMPKLDGLELLRRIRAGSEKSWLPVILVTAANDREARLKGFEAGADEFVEKPVDPALLLVRVRTLLRLREAQERLGERARALEALHEERRELMHFVVHDLKNPLSVIHANLQFIRPAITKLPPEFGEAFDDAAFAAQRIRGLVIDLLNVEQLEQSSLRVERQAIDVAELVLEVARSHQREADLRDLRLRVVAADATVHADPDLLRRVVENLLENALHHTPPNGSIELRSESGSEVAIHVSNSGTPIPIELRDSLFSKYVRGPGRERGHYGLGLYFCKRVAAAHNGSVMLVERPGWPVSFRFALPARPVQALAG